MTWRAISLVDLATGEPARSFLLAGAGKHHLPHAFPLIPGLTTGEPAKLFFLARTGNIVYPTLSHCSWETVIFYVC